MTLALSTLSQLWLWVAAAFGLLSVLGLWDFLQPNQAIRRNYPVVGNLRFLFEKVRPEIRMR